MINERHYDVVVIGAGTAGMVAAVRAAQQGARVVVIAKGHGSTHLAPGTIDVAGFLPSGEGPAPVAESAEDGVQATIAAHPEHPYAKLGAAGVSEAVSWFHELLATGSYHYVGGLDRNQLLPTAVGALRPSALVPRTMCGGDSRGLSKVAIVGSPQLRDFHASVCADNLVKGGIDARAFSVPLLLEASLNRADVNTTLLARAADDPGWRARFCVQLQELIGDAEQVGLPAILGLRDPAGAHADFEARLERKVFEIPTLPPSVPGIRLFEALRTALRAARGQLVFGPEVVDAERESSGRLQSVTAHSAGHNTIYRADHYVLATGGFGSGGIELDSRWQTREKIFNLPLSGLPGDEHRFDMNYFGEHPYARVGVATDSQLRAEGAENLLVAGAALAGATAWREGSGEGVAISSGYRAAQVIGASLSDNKEVVA